MSDDPRCRIILVRCASPPDSVPDGRSRLRYPSPISTNESSRCPRLRSSGATPGSSSPRTHVARSVICIAQASAIETPRIFEDRAGAASRVPSHSGQAWNTTARSTNARMCGCMLATSLESIDFWILGTSPSKVRLMLSIRTLRGSP